MSLLPSAPHSFTLLDAAIYAALVTNSLAVVLIASICHGPQFLISTTAFSCGARITGVDDILLDLSNAGFAVEKTDVVYDEQERLLTARSPAVLKQFCEKLAKCINLRSPLSSSGAEM